ncbi:hypothetical protein B0T22DRAFT_225055 [Podospora appendiculata]|uniref:Methyltransferase type 11 domain-containing protein n=1 Tax=Podospora appendiculata TaxID=314037 RepID=A0AAE0X5V7_9PEZI|nr:hypothetical protein B0T22DRAFT_225055 [Podospora appendiculata]
MVPLRSGSDTSGWSGVTGPREFDAHMEHSQRVYPPAPSLRSSKGSEGSRERVRTIPQPKMSSRLPQSLSQRRPSNGQSEQPQIDLQSRSRVPIVLGNLGTSATHPLAPYTSPPNSLPLPGSKRRNVLRRKHSGLSQETTSTRNDSREESHRTSSSSSNPRSQTSLDATASLHFDRNLTTSPMEIRIAQQVEVPRTGAHAITIYPELDRYRSRPQAQDERPSIDMPYPIATHDLPPPTPLFSATSSQISGFSGSPSTRFSDSPGPSLGPYSRDTTPTSISSQSPGLVAPLRIPASMARMRQLDPSQTRPPVSRRRTGSISNEKDPVSVDPHGLAAVRESLTSSSSNSTVRDENKKEKKKTRLLPFPPSPPPRKSSQKFKKSRDEDESPSKPSREPAQPVMPSPPTAKATSYARSRPLQTTQPVASPKAAPPLRPSRDGTPDLQAQLGKPLPIIHSNLSSTSLSERRHSSLVAPAPVSRPVLSSSLPSPHSYLSRAPVGREATPAPQTTSKTESGRALRTPSPSVSAFKTRFPIFARRTKTAAEVPPQQEKKDKPARKGPAAGTGHEGYGRLGSARRKSGSISNTIRAIPGTMSSQESLGSNQSHDPFLMERMAPVVIAGGEIVENRNTSSELNRTESNQSFSFRRPSVESKNSSQVSLSSREGTRHTLWPSPFPRGSMQAPSLGSRRPSDSSDSEAPAIKSSLALRRSMQRLKSGEQETPRLPKPIVTRPQVVSPSITSMDASMMSDDSMFGHHPETTKTSKGLGSSEDASGPKKLMKRARSPRKWNFFSRSHSQPAVEKSATEMASTIAVPATVEVVQAKPVAFYTMMDSSEDADTPDLEEVLREARSIAPHSLEPKESARKRRPSVTGGQASDELTRLTGAIRAVDPQKSQPSTIPIRAVASPANTHRPLVSRTQTAPVLVPPPIEKPTPPQASGRPSRLPQVGRIPKVVSARAQQISPKSFSRPFHRLSIQAPPPTVEFRDEDFVAKGPTPPKPSTPELTQDEPSTTNGASSSAALISSLLGELSSDANQFEQEFISFSPRKNSQCTVTTTSSSSGGHLAYAVATAVVPEPHAPLAEDEIWDEYNDLLGDEALRIPPSAGSSLGKPFHLERYKSKPQNEVEPALESPTFNPNPMQSLDEAMRPAKEPVTSSIYSTDVTEQIKQALDTAPPPSTPLPEIEFPGSQASNSKQTKRDSDISERRARQSDASGSSRASTDSSPLSQVNLRVGSMTVSKWLSFGHVLFSPVRDELLPVVGSLKRHSILVIDGLGNDDWSFYAAETYPAATFFNLSPRAPLPATHQSSSAFPLSPPNHHQIQYLSHAEKFPFGPQSFTSVVFRFPVAAPESEYRNIISEARRVIKPGGYIELSILDVDLNNMGNRGRRAVRRLKERINTRAPETSLGSTSDLILRLLGRKGFTEIKNCRVGVPVASAVVRSSGSEAGDNIRKSSTGSSDGSAKGKHQKDDRSLPELISEEGPVADENITKVVAKVGRWWYNRCYESAAACGSGSRASMWSDKALLAECEEWGTSLKLMVCHARVPDGRARVASI